MIMGESITAEIFIKKDCCLCNDAKVVLDKVPRWFSVKDDGYRSRPDGALSKKNPVVMLNGEESFVYKVYEITLCKKIEKILSGINAS